MRFRSVAAALALVTAMLMGLAAAALADEGGHGGWRAYARGFERGFARGVDFRDLDDAPWAAKFITAGQISGVIRGFEDGTFRPNQPVNRAQAVAMTVRALGLEDKARQVGEDVYLKLPFQDAAAIPAWAASHVRLALDMGLLQETDGMFQPHRAASRVWVVPMLVKALGLRSQAEARMNEQMQFKDAASLPAGTGGYVAVAVDLGLIAGFPDNTFRPFQPVTRAQMAKMLEVVQDQLDQNNRGQQGARYVVSGVVYAVTANSVSLRTAGSQPAVYSVVYNAPVYLDDKPAMLADLKAGMVARLFLNNQREAVFVDAHTARPAPVPRPNPFLRELKGTVASADPAALTISVYGRDGAVQTFDVADWAQIEIKGMGYATLADVSPGDQVELKLRDGLVVKIEVKAGDDDRSGRWDGWRGSEGWSGQVAGVVTALGDDVITVLTASGRSYDIPVDARTQIAARGWFASGAGYIQPGDRVEVVVRQGVALRIKVESGSGSQGLMKKFKEKRKHGHDDKDD